MKNVKQKGMLYHSSIIISLQIYEKYYAEIVPSILKLSYLIVSIFLGHPVVEVWEIFQRELESVELEIDTLEIQRNEKPLRL